MDPAAIQQMMKMLADAITSGQQNMAQQAQVQSKKTIPPLPDIQAYECTDDRNKISDFLQRFAFALDCANPQADDDVKVKCLMNKLSEGAFAEYSKSILPAKVTDHTFDVTINKLEKLFAKPQSLWLDRYECLKATRTEGEEFQSFVNRHRMLLRNFDFSALKEEQFKVLMLLTSLKSGTEATLRQRILTKLAADGDLIKYDTVIDELNNFMCTIEEAKALEIPSNRNINAVQHKNFKGGSKHKNSGIQQKGQNSSGSRPCWRCGGSHQANDCQHKSTECRKCKFKGHLDRMCDKVQEWRKNQPKFSSRKNPNMKHLQLGTASLHNSNLLKLSILMNEKPVLFALDTGCEANLIDEFTYTKIGSPPIRKCNEQGRLFDGSLKPFLGKGRGTFKFNGIEIKDDFYLAPKGSLNLLSIQLMDGFGLLDDLKKKINIAQIGLKSDKYGTLIKKSVEEIKSKFADLFTNSLGHCTKVKAHLTLKDGAQPIYRRARPVPYNSRDVIDRELDRLENLGVIEKIEHSNWAAPILVVKKTDGSARLCIDYSTGLNEALKDHTHPLPIPEDIFATLNGGKFFSQIDLRDAYFQIELDEESQQICAISTHRGNFKVNRLPFGVKTAPAIFQSIMDAMLAGMNCAAAYLDDIIIVSESAEQHAKDLKEVFERLQNYGFRIKLEKCSFFKKSIHYLGLIIDENGRKPDPEKIKAITNMPHPSDVPTLRSYLGMVNHYQQFIKNMRFVRRPLDDLLKKDTKWEWNKECEQAFEKIKEILSSDLLLTHYDPSLEIVVAADASESGIGAVISHKFPDGSVKAIAHASSSLTPAEKNYSQIEKEGLALIFAVQKFHKMIYGRHFTLQTDHKPLLSIFGSKKGVKQCSANRLLRWSLILLAYDFDIEYVNTLEFGQADALSRLIAKGDKGENERVIASLGTELEMNSILTEAVQTLPIKFNDIIKATEQDDTIGKIKKFVQHGWPDEKKMVTMDEKIKAFHRRKSDLSIVNGCLMSADRIVIPEIYQKKVLKTVHIGHPGIKRMKQLARNYVYWPKIDTDIENLVKTCEPCQLQAKAPIKTNLHSWPKTTGPWQRVHMDYAGPFFGKEFLIVVDAHSKYPEVFEMATKSTTATIAKLRYLSTRHGLPDMLVSDNGTQFTSKEFNNFTEINGIKHYFSAPYNPMSNGQAERFVDIFKRTFRKLKGEGTPSKESIDTFLVTYRTTPNDSLPNAKSPAEVFLGRKPKTTLDLLRPPQVQPIERNEEMEKNFNRRFGTKPRSFQLGDKVFARHRSSQSWKAGIVTKCTGVIYDVRFANSSVGRFHANQLRSRQTGNWVEDPLSIFNEAFNLPQPPVAQEEIREENENLEVPLENHQGPQNGEGNEMGQNNANAGPIRRNPQRVRRPPNKYSPKR